MVLWFNDNESQPGEPPGTCVLLEIVSARDLDLSHKKSLLDQDVDPYCIVRMNGKEVHKTSTISNDPDPIWTVKTGSLCLLKIPTHDGDETTEETIDDAIKQNGVSEETSVVVEVCHGNQCLGIVMVPFSKVLESQGDREEYPVCVSSGEQGGVVCAYTLCVSFFLCIVGDSSCSCRVRWHCAFVWRRRTTFYFLETPAPNSGPMRLISI
jgi:hypothetical protein